MKGLSIYIWLLIAVFIIPLEMVQAESDEANDYKTKLVMTIKEAQIALDKAKKEKDEAQDAYDTGRDVPDNEPALKETLQNAELNYFQKFMDHARAEEQLHLWKTDKDAYEIELKAILDNAKIELANTEKTKDAAQANYNVGKVIPANEPSLKRTLDEAVMNHIKKQIALKIAEKQWRLWTVEKLKASQEVTFDRRVVLEGMLDTPISEIEDSTASGGIGIDLTKISEEDDEYWLFSSSLHFGSSATVESDEIQDREFARSLLVPGTGGFSALVNSLLSKTILN